MVFCYLRNRFFITPIHPFFDNNRTHRLTHRGSFVSLSGFFQEPNVDIFCFFPGQELIKFYPTIIGILFFH